MPELSQDAIRELRQGLPLLKRLLRTVTQYSEQKIPIPQDEIQQLQNAYDRVSRLTSPVDVKTWVGDKSLIAELEELEHSTIGAGFFSQIEFNVDALRQNRVLCSYAERLVLYVQGILEDKEAEEMLNRLTQENTSLKEQLAEIHQRELTYLSIIGEAQTATTYSPPLGSNKILLSSLERQRAIVTKNLGTVQEQKAQYGLDPPLRLLNTIDQLQEDLKTIDNTIGYLKANITEMK